MSKSTPTLDIYYEICIRQIAYLYYSWSSLNTTEDKFYNANVNKLNLLWKIVE